MSVELVELIEFDGSADSVGIVKSGRLVEPVELGASLRLYLQVHGRERAAAEIIEAVRLLNTCASVCVCWQFGLGRGEGGVRHVR
jgi:hypothetical protein